MFPCVCVFAHECVHKGSSTGSLHSLYTPEGQEEPVPLEEWHTARVCLRTHSRTLCTLISGDGPWVQEASRTSPAVWLQGGWALAPPPRRCCLLTVPGTQWVLTSPQSGSQPGRSFVRPVRGGLCGSKGPMDGDESFVCFVFEITKQQLSILNHCPLALGILTDNLSHRFLCLKTSRVLSEFSKAQVNSVPTNGLGGLGGEADIPTGRASLSLPGPEASIPSDGPAEPLPAQASPVALDGHHKQHPPACASGALGLPLLGTAQALPLGSALGQQPGSPMRVPAQALAQGSGQQKPPEDDGAAWSLGVSSPTSPVSGASFSGGGPGGLSQSWCRASRACDPEGPLPSPR